MTDSIGNKCFQCGCTEFEWPDDATTDSDWILCAGCGERFITISELRQRLTEDAVENAKNALGFYDFKPRSEGP